MDKRSDRIFSLLSKLRFGGGILLLALIIVFAAVFTQPAGETTDTVRDSAVAGNDCAVVQTMRFTRCQHQVTRRVQISQACVGLDREAIEKVYKDWQLDTFSEKEITMSRDIELYCPLHYVLMANESGGLSVYQNRFGDAMAWLEDISGQMSAYSEEIQEKLLRGIGYDSMDELQNALQNGLD